MPDLLIVGAGPTGLTLACELAVRGVPFRLVDAADGPIQGSRAKGVQPRTLEVFDRLGIVDEVVAAGGQRAAVAPAWRRRRVPRRAASGAGRTAGAAVAVADPVAAVAH